LMVNRTALPGAEGQTSRRRTNGTYTITNRFPIPFYPTQPVAARTGSAFKTTPPSRLLAASDTYAPTLHSKGRRVHRIHRRKSLPLEADGKTVVGGTHNGLSLRLFQPVRARWLPAFQCSTEASIRPFGQRNHRENIAELSERQRLFFGVAIQEQWGHCRGSGTQNGDMLAAPI